LTSLGLLSLFGLTQQVHKQERRSKLTTATRVLLFLLFYPHGYRNSTANMHVKYIN